MTSRLPLLVLGGAVLAPGLLSPHRPMSIAAEKPGEASGEFVRVATDPGQAIRQGDTSGCGPVSLLNMLKLGPEPYRKAYVAISQGDDKRALARLAEKYCSEKGTDGKARYTND